MMNIDARDLPRNPGRFAVVVARFNEPVTSKLLDGCQRGFMQEGVPVQDVDVFHVPGALELPLVCDKLASRVAGYQAIVALAAVVRGETYHFEIVSDVCTRGLMKVNLKHGIPVIVGVITVDNAEQAYARCGAGDDNKGFEAAIGAVEMATLLHAAGTQGPISGVS